MSVPTGSVEPPDGLAGRLPRRALVISATIGAGHDTAAYGVEQTAHRLWPKCDLRRIDVFDAMGMGIGPVLRWLYVVNVQLTPWLYEFFYGALWAYPWAARGAKRLVGAWSGRRLAAHLEGYNPDLIASTHPIASAGLAWLRRHRTLDVPVAVWVADFATHPFWLYRDLDLHLVMHESCAETASAAEPGITVRVGAPSVSDTFRPGDRMAARRRTGLCPDSFVVLVSCGYFGFGTMERAVDALLEIDPGVQVVVVCGRNERLRSQLASRGLPAARLHLLGWVDDMASYTVAADMVVTNAGGATALETLCCGRPLVLFEPIAAHGRANAEAMARPGLAVHSGSRRELTRVVRRLMEDPIKRAAQEERSLEFARKRSRASDLRALVPLMAGRPHPRRPAGPRRRRFRPRRSRQTLRRPAAERSRSARETVRPEDAFFLYTQTPDIAQQVGGIAMLQQSTLTFSEVVAEMRHRVDALPNLRRRLAPPKRRWGRPTWIVDETIDLSVHLKERVLGVDGEPASFDYLADGFFSTPVDLNRPPWEMHFVRGLDDGRSALLVKLHHTMGDGFAAIDTLSGLLDEIGGPAKPSAGSAPMPDPGQGASPRRRALARLATPALVLSGMWDLGRGGRAPSSSINGIMAGPARHVVSFSLSAAEVRDLAGRLGARKSELVLTVVAEAFHRVLDARGEESGPLVAMVPRTMRTAKTLKAPGNWTGGLRVKLPCGPMPLSARLHATQRRLQTTLRYGQPQASRFLMRALGAVPAPLEKTIARRTYGSQWFNLIISVIPGPRRPQAFVGVPLVKVYPVLPLAEGVGLAVGVLTWADTVTVGIMTDMTLVSDADRLAEEMRASFAALQGLAAR